MPRRRSWLKVVVVGYARGLGNCGGGCASVGGGTRVYYIIITVVHYLTDAGQRIPELHCREVGRLLISFKNSKPAPLRA